MNLLRDYYCRLSQIIHLCIKRKYTYYSTSTGQLLVDLWTQTSTVLTKIIIFYFINYCKTSERDTRTNIMIEPISYLISSCFNGTVNAVTRLVLIVLSAFVYHCFVFGEVFLNSYYLLYPPVLETPVGKVQSVVAGASNYVVKIVATKVGSYNLYI